MLKITKGHFQKFFAVSFAIQDKRSQYVAPLKNDLKRFLSTENPLFPTRDSFEMIVCEKNGDLAGRLVVHEHRKSNELHREKKALFGFFDCIDDLEVAQALFSEAEAWAKSRGLTSLSGNFNLTAMQQVGVMTAGFENPPYMDQTYSPPHHAKLLEALGYKPTFPMSTFELPLADVDPSKLLGDKQKKLLAQKNLRFGTLVKKRFAESLDATRKVLNDGFAKNPMFVPLTNAEIMFQAKDMVYIVDEAISSVVYEGNDPIGVVICVPDINQFLIDTKSRIGLLTPYYFFKNLRARHRAVIIFYSVCERWHNQGLNGAMLYHVLTALKTRGYKSLGLTWIADSNHSSIRQAEKLGARLIHRLDIFRKELEI